MEELNSAQTVMYVLWSILAICIGLFSAFFNKKFTEGNAKRFEWMYKKTNISIFKNQAEQMKSGSMQLFSRLIGVAFIVIGVVTLLKVLG